MIQATSVSLAASSKFNTQQRNTHLHDGCMWIYDHKKQSNTNSIDMQNEMKNNDIKITTRQIIHLICHTIESNIQTWGKYQINMLCTFQK